MEKSVRAITRNQRTNRQNQTNTGITFQLNMNLSVISRKPKVFEIKWFEHIFKRNNINSIG